MKVELSKKAEAIVKGVSEETKMSFDTTLDLLIHFGFAFMEMNADYKADGSE